jgi:hypothetical protein
MHGIALSIVTVQVLMLHIQNYLWIYKSLLCIAAKHAQYNMSKAIMMCFIEGIMSTIIWYEGNNLFKQNIISVHKHYPYLVTFFFFHEINFQS